jgi:hypothetical protein
VTEISEQLFRATNKMKPPHFFSLIPTLLWTDFHVRPPAGKLRLTKSAPGGFVPEGEGLAQRTPLPAGEGKG